MKYIYFICVLLSVSLFPGSGQAAENSPHSLTLELTASGIWFDKTNAGQDGFDAYAASPGIKAFAASLGEDKRLGAWGKA